MSTHSQREDLERQEAKLREYAKQHFPNANLLLYRRITSGLNFENPIFLRLIKDICEGKFSGGYLLCTFKDRVIRFGFKLIQQLCKLHGVTLIQIEQEEPKSLMEELTADILNLTHIASCSLYGRRSSRNHFDISPDVIRDVTAWHFSGLSLKAIYRKLSEAGRAVNGRGKPFRVAVVRRIVLQAKANDVLPAIAGQNRRSHFADFAKVKLLISENKEARVDREKVLTSYRDWLAKKLGKDAPAQTRRQCLRALQEHLASLPSNSRPSVRANRDKNGVRKVMLVGVSLLGNRWESS